MNSERSACLICDLDQLQAGNAGDADSFTSSGVWQCQTGTNGHSILFRPNLMRVYCSQCIINYANVPGQAWGPSVAIDRDGLSTGCCPC